jgi:gliding motility-associated lipoprotein GldH
MKKNSIIILIFVAIFVLTSCDRNKVYEEYIEIDNNVWLSSNVVKFEFEIDDTAALHNVYINVRHAAGYQFNNLWLFVKSSAPNGQTSIDTLECVLSDKKGKWLGDGMGDIYDMQLPWRLNVRFPVKGKYTVEYRQGMRIDALPGIMDMGLRVEKAEEK